MCFGLGTESLKSAIEGDCWVSWSRGQPAELEITRCIQVIGLTTILDGVCVGFPYFMESLPVSQPEVN
jgi:hypothetical protein